MENFNRTLKLTGSSIDQISHVLGRFLSETKTEHATKLRIRLSVEEALLRLRDHFGQDQEIRVFIGRMLGRYEFQVDLIGEAYNPLSLKDNEIENWSSSLLTNIGMSPTYYYSGGRNKLRLVLPHEGMNPVFKLLICVLLGTLFGLSGKTFLPLEVRMMISTSVLEPLSHLWMRTLTLLSGPLIFVLVLTTILNMGRIDVQGGDRKRVLFRYILNSVAAGVGTLLVMNLILPLTYHANNLDASQISSLLDVLFHVVPEDMINPFIEVNTAQLVFMAIVIGNGISLLRGDGDILVGIVKQFYDLGLMLADWVGTVVPFFAVSLMTLAFWNEQTRIFLHMWIPFLIFAVLSLIFSVITMLRLKLRRKVSLRMLWKKLKTSFMVTIRTGSLNEAYTYIESSCIKSLGIDRHFTKALLPSGLVLYMPVSTIELVAFSIYAAWIHHCDATFGWYFLLIFLAVVLSMASPPVAGVSLISFMTIFSQLGIPSEALVGGMIADIILGIAAGAFNQMLLQLEMLDEADRTGLVNYRVLLKDKDKEKANEHG